MQIRAGLRLGIATHVGKRRNANEDDVLVFEPKDLVLYNALGRILAIADGMGGVRGGAEASRLAIRTMLASYLDGGDGGTFDEARLADAFRAASRSVYDASLQNPHLRGMGTTLLVARIHRGWVELAHVGDSRCLLVRGGRAQQLTEDHTARGPGSELVRCIGGGRNEETVDTLRRELKLDDRLVLCTDGVWSTVPVAEIVEVVNALDPVAAAGELVRRANLHGGPDNATVIVAQIGDPSKNGAEPSPAVRILTEVDVPVATPLPSGPSDRPRWPWVVLGSALVVAAVALAKIMDHDLVDWLLAWLR
jgi:protein phosphatase